MTQQTADLPITHGEVRAIINANASDAQTRLAKADKCRTGFADFNDLATHSTPISLDETDGFVLLTNDKAGAFTNISYLPEGITTDVFTSNQFDFSQLNVGDQINIRLDLSATTTTPNQQIDVQLRVGIGTPAEFTIPFIQSQYKNAGSHSLNRFNGIYIGSNDIKNYPAQFEIASDDALSVVVNGWFMQFLLRGEAA